MYTPKEMYYNCHHHFGFTGKIIVEDVDTPQMFPTAAADPNLDKLDALSEFEEQPKPTSNVYFLFCPSPQRCAKDLPGLRRTLGALHLARKRSRRSA